MNYTTHYNLQKDLTIEKYNVNVVNMNSDIIDSALHRLDLKDKSQDELLATKESLNNETTRASTKENDIVSDLLSEISRAKSAEKANSDNISDEVSRALLSEEAINAALQAHLSDESNPHKLTKEQLELDNVDNTSDINKPVSTAQQNALNSALSTHNTSDSAHSDMRLLISGLTTRLNALADSDDTTLDQLSEIVAYIKNNKNLIDGITTSKVNVSDIIDDLTSSATDKTLSAKQGMILKGLITDLTTIIGNKVDKASGKGLSTNDYTTAEKNKLSGIAAGAEVNVQPDWNVTDPASDAFIKNKPTLISESDIFPISNGGTGASTYYDATNNLKTLSLLPAEAIPANSDLNNYLTAGTYVVKSGTIAKTINNTPFQDFGYRLVVYNVYGIENSIQYMCQIAENRKC